MLLNTENVSESRFRLAKRTLLEIPATLISLWRHNKLSGEVGATPHALCCLATAYLSRALVIESMATIYVRRCYANFTSGTRRSTWRLPCIYRLSLKRLKLLPSKLGASFEIARCINMRAGFIAMRF